MWFSMGNAHEPRQGAHTWQMGNKIYRHYEFSFPWETALRDAETKLFIPVDAKY